MADNDVPTGESESTAGQGDQPTRPEVESGAQEDPTPVRRAEPAEKPEEKPADPQIQSWQAVTDSLNKMFVEAGNRESKMNDQIHSALEELKGLVNQPMVAPPQGVTAPPPITEQQKGGLAEFVTNLLKFGALTAIAFGIGRRGGRSSYIWKSAIGAALGGYARGRKDVSDSAMRVWEKNREIINDTNREQNANYRAILQDRRLALSQKMDLINALSTEFRDYRTAEASRRQDLMALQKTITDQMKAQRDKEKWEFDHRHKIYDVLGKGNINGQYFAWIHEKSGLNMDANWTADQYYDFVKEHPELHFSEFLKERNEEELKKTREKAEATQRGREAGKKPEETPPDPEAAKKAGKILEGLVQ